MIDSSATRIKELIGIIKAEFDEMRIILLTAEQGINKRDDEIKQLKAENAELRNKLDAWVLKREEEARALHPSSLRVERLRTFESTFKPEKSKPEGVGKAWCSVHGRHPGECFEAHHVSD